MTGRCLLCSLVDIVAQRVWPYVMIRLRRWQLPIGGSYGPIGFERPLWLIMVSLCVTSVLLRFVMCRVLGFTDVLCVLVLMLAGVLIREMGGKWLLKSLNFTRTLGVGWIACGWGW